MSEPMPDPVIERIAVELSRPVPLRADFDARVMARVRSAPPSVFANLAGWLTEPRTVAVSPIGGLALAAGVAGLVMVGALAGDRGSRSEERGSPPSILDPRSSIPVAFVFIAPDARAVALAGDFNGWDTSETPMTRNASGLWTVELPLAPGRYGYAFVVDGRRFVADPAAPSAPDDFGAPTSVITVSGAAPGEPAPGGAL